jgi:hypothetical protein
MASRGADAISFGISTQYHPRMSQVAMAMPTVQGELAPVTAAGQGTAQMRRFTRRS